MQKLMRCFLFVVTLATFFSHTVFAQQQIKIGTDIPLQYGLAYKYSPDYGIGGSLKLGFLTEPHNSIILSVMEAFGTKKYLVDIAREGFKIGLVLDGSPSWHWNNNYIGANVIFINLRGGEAPLDVIDDNFEYDMFSFWDPLSSIFSDESMQIDLKSNLLQLGVHYGRRIPLKEKLELQLEFGISKNIGSTNKFTSDFSYPEVIYNSIDSELQEAYRKYAIIPSLGVYLVYNL